MLVPLLPLRDIVVFPHMVVPLFVGREKSVRALEEAMERFDRRPGKYRKLIEDYPERFLFGTDLVVTDHPQKSVGWMQMMVKGYFDLLESGSYEFPYLPDKKLKGLGLPRRILRMIYERNIEAILPR